MLWDAGGHSDRVTCGSFGCLDVGNLEYNISQYIIIDPYNVYIHEKVYLIFIFFVTVSYDIRNVLDM